MADTIPTDAAQRGIAKTIAGLVLQNYTITENPVRQEYADQNGAIKAGAQYDTRFDLNAVGYSQGAAYTKPTGNTFTFDGKTWLIDNVQEAGTYNDVTRYTIAAHRYAGYPSAS